jgi:ABC-2 type transport system ATP-binding protein
MWEYLKNLNKNEGTTIFFTTHYMEEADRIAERIAIIDHGKIIASGTSVELKERTSTQSLEDAFLSITGNTIREDQASSVDHMRASRKMWKR